MPRLAGIFGVTLSRFEETLPKGHTPLVRPVLLADITFRVSLNISYSIRSRNFLWSHWAKILNAVSAIPLKIQ